MEKPKTEDLTPYGSDRVRAGKGADQWILFSRRSKGWVPRVPKSLTHSEHPGTAVLWNDRFFEVVAAEGSDQTGVRYVLEPWRDHHVIRVSENYDAATEAQREIEIHANDKRVRHRKAANLLGIFTGLLPAIAQEQLGSELGLLPTKLTALSLIVPFAFVVWIINEWVRRTMNPNLGAMPFSLDLAAAYFLLECAIRLNIAWFHQRPIGSLLGFFPYLLYYATVGKSRGAVSPFAEAKGYKFYVTQPTEDVALRDAYSMREPLLTLLSVEEQKALAERFGFDYRKHGFIVAFFLLFASAAGVVSALASMQYGPRFSAIVSLLLGLAIGGEQILRLQTLRRGPAPSMLAGVIRPLTRKLLR